MCLKACGFQAIVCFHQCERRPQTVEERFKDLTIALGALSDVKDSGFFKAVSGVN
jgi:hypothetical protein